MFKVIFFMTFCLPNAFADSPVSLDSKKICEKEADDLSTLLKDVQCSWISDSLDVERKKLGICQGDLKCIDPKDTHHPEFNVRYDLRDSTSASRPSCGSADNSCGAIDSVCRDQIVDKEKKENVCTIEPNDKHFYDKSYQPPPDTPPR